MLPRKEFKEDNEQGKIKYRDCLVDTRYTVYFEISTINLLVTVNLLYFKLYSVLCIQRSRINI